MKTANSSTDHWYTTDARPAYGATLREARKAGLLPSVTTILKVWPKSALDRWKQEQIILSCLTTPRLPGEPDDAYVNRIITCAEAESRAAADVGSRRHDWMEQWNQGIAIRELDCKEDWPFLQPYIEWFSRNVDHTIQAETIVVNKELGYAGKLDLLCRLKDGRTAVVDAKNRKTVRAYETDCQQLEAYRVPVMADTTISVVLGTQEPGILVREWNAGERFDGWANFQLCLSLWKAAKQYWPERHKPAEVA